MYVIFKGPFLTKSRLVTEYLLFILKPALLPSTSIDGVWSTTSECRRNAGRRCRSRCVLL